VKLVVLHTHHFHPKPKFILFRSNKLSKKSLFGFFRPGKYAFHLLRAALPHLRLLTLPLDQLSLLSNYLSPQEKGFLSAKLLFNEGNSSDLEAPPSLNTTTEPREPAKVSLASLSVKLELIPENSIIIDHFKMPGEALFKIQSDWSDKEVFEVDFVDVSHNLFLTGVETLTRGNNRPKFKQGDSNR